MKTLLKDQNQLEKFLKVFFDYELEKDEVIFLSLIARKKYWEKLTNNQSMMDRKIVKSTDMLVQKVANISVVEGRYFFQGKVIPEKAFAVYIDLSPKSMMKGLTKLQKEIADAMYEVAQSQDYHKVKNMLMSFYSAIHTSNASGNKGKYFLVDIDTKDYSVMKFVEKVLKENIKAILETRGGYHIYVPKNEKTGELLFREQVFSSLSDVEVKSKNFLTPVAGTLQGGKLVRIFD